MSELRAELAAALAEPLTPAGVAATFIRAIRPLLAERLTATAHGYDPVTDSTWVLAADGPDARTVGSHYPFSGSLPADLRAQLMERHAPLVLPDTRADTAAFAPYLATGPHMQAVRFFCSCPLVSQGQVVGFFNVRGPEPRALPPERLELLAELGRLLAGPLHLALLLSQAEAQASRRALIERVEERVADNPDLDGVVGATLEDLALAFRVSRAVVWLGETEAEQQLAYEWNADGVPPIGIGTPIGSVAVPMVLRMGRTLAIADTGTDPRLDAPEGRAIYARSGIVGALAATLGAGGRLLGVLALHQLGSPRRWSEADVRQIETVARELAIAVAHARQLQERRRQSERLLALVRLNRLISSSLDRDAVLLEISRAAAELSGAVVASFWLVDEPTRSLELLGMSDPALDADQAFRKSTFGHGAAGWVALHRRPMISDDVFADGITGGLDWWRRHDLLSSYTVPVLDGEALLAVLSMNGREPFRLGADDRELLDSFLAQAAVAIRNASLYAAVRRSEEQLQTALVTQRAANEQLEALNKAKSDFVSVVSHEFRTPLTGIQAFSDLMRDEEFPIQEMKEFAADISREAERLNRMIGEMLDLDRMESGRMTLHLESVDLGAVAREVVASFRPSAPKHALQLEIEPSLPPVRGDRDKLTQVVLNLVSNAIKYSPDGGAVAVGARAEGADAHLWVSDQGTGIPTEALEAVFERYARVEIGPSRYVQGTGLGLPITRQIAELHGGRAWAESAVGHGSTCSTPGTARKQSICPERWTWGWCCWTCRCPCWTGPPCAASCGPTPGWRACRS